MTDVQDTAALTREQSDEALQRFADGFSSPRRSPVLHSPSEHGLGYEDITFPARDGVPLEGWFIPAPGSSKLIIANHPVGFSRSGIPSRYASQDERVVAGQHLMQAESDIFLGWTRATDPDGVDRDYYERQLKDWKFSAPIEQMNPSSMASYAGLCGWTLARAHARSGDRIALAAYLGGSGKFDQAIAGFAEKYADQNERDHAALQAAVKDGRAEATTDI